MPAAQAGQPPGPGRSTPVPDLAMQPDASVAIMNGWTARTLQVAHLSPGSLKNCHF